MGAFAGVETLDFWSVDMRRFLLVLSLVLVVCLLFVPANAYAHPPADTPPTPTPAATQQPEDKKGGGRPTITYVLNPAQAVRKLVTEILTGLFSGIAKALLPYTGTMYTRMTSVLLGQNTLRQEDKFQQAARLFQNVARVIFILAALTRLIWYHKAELQGLQDSLVSVFVDWVVIGVLVMAVPSIMEWSERFASDLARLVLVQAGNVISIKDLTENIVQILVPSNPVTSFLYMLLAFVTFITFLGLFASVITLQMAMFLFSVLTPFLLSLSLIPPFRFLRKMLLFAYMILLMAPSIAALALLTTGWAISSRVGGEGMIGLLARVLWAMAMAGVLWKVVGFLSMAGLDAFKSVAGATLQAARLAGSVLLGLAALPAAGAGAAALGAGGAAAKTAAGATASSMSAEQVALATRHLSQAERLGTAAQILGGPGSMGGRLGGAATAYARSLRSRLERDLARSATPPHRDYRDVTKTPHSDPFHKVAKRLGIPDMQTYQQSLQKAQARVIVANQDANLISWSTENDPEKGPLAAALAVLYHRDPDRFNALVDEGWSALEKAAQDLLQQKS